jgi:N-acetylmuramoyl-L-alanine amidase
LANYRWMLPWAVGLWVILSQPAEGTSLDYWRFNARQNRLELVTDDDVKPKVRLLEGPIRLVVDLPSTRLGQQRGSKAIGSFVREVRVAQLNPQTVRVVVELGSQYTLRPYEIQVQGLAPNRWSVQLPKLQPLDSQLPLPKGSVAIAVPDRPTSSVASPVPARSPTKPVTADIPVPAAKPYPKARVVVSVDPGHGGPDPGAVGIGGIQEKKIVLDIGLKVVKALQRQGIQAVITRPDDRDLDLAPRVAQAKKIKARAFVSIHANAISLSRPEVNGLETYYYGPGNAYRLAQLVHRSILSRVSIVDRGIRQARFYVLRYTPMPAILVETGYVTGRQDAKNFASQAFRTRMAEAIATGVVQYFR